MEIFHVLSLPGLPSDCLFVESSVPFSGDASMPVLDPLRQAFLDRKNSSRHFNRNTFSDAWLLFGLNPLQMD